MNTFTVTLIAVAVMLAYAIPGYATVKTKLIKPEAIPAFATILMYVCQPCLTIYSITLAPYSWALFSNMMIFFALALLIQGGMMLVFYMIFRKKGKENAKYRICALATSFGNCGFMGVPLLEAIFPNQPEPIMMSACFLIAMNLLGWTVGSALITNDKKYINVKKALFNPAMIGLFIALPFFFTNSYGYVPQQITSMIALLGKMTTPLCMLIMGMRLATIAPKSLFGKPIQYITVAIKQILMPLLGLLIVMWLPLEDYFKKTMFIMCATPVASVVLNFAEMLGEGQETAANLVLLGTSMSIITIPIMMLIL